MYKTQYAEIMICDIQRMKKETELQNEIQQHTLKANKIQHSF